MRTRCAFLLGSVLLLASPLPADWVVLKDGTRLRGIDYKKKRDGFTFTLDDGTVLFLRAALVESHEPSPAGETVEFRGRQTTLREMVTTLRAEARARDEAALRDLRLWAEAQVESKEKEAGLKGKQAAQKEKEAGAARERFAALEEIERERLLGLALANGKTKPVRFHAARELGKHKTTHAVRALSAAAVMDRFRSVRDAALSSLQAVGDPETAGNFVPYLRSRSPQERINSANALSLFPSRRAVPELIAAARLTWAGFGRGFIFQGVQRAYISDYELVSGGTGFAIIEVADPVIQTNVEGVALDVDVVRVEMVAELRALHKATAQDFGTDFDRWQAWWDKNKDAPEPGAQNAPPVAADPPDGRRARD